MTSLYQAVDAHTHLDFPLFDTDRPAVLERAQQAGVVNFMLAGADPAHWDRVQQMATELHVGCSLGIHPWWAGKMTTEQIEAAVTNLAARHDHDAVGEIGLDWARSPEGSPERDAQWMAFGMQFEHALAQNYPIVLHVVRAYPEVLGVLAAHDLPVAGGMIHGWSGDPDFVEMAVELGLYVSFGPRLASSGRVREAIKRVPLERLLLETDCPDQPFAGQTRGEPADLVRVAECAASVRSESIQTLLQVSGENARTLFPTLE